MIPRPRELAVPGGSVPFHDDLLRHRPDDPSLGAEGYRLEITASAAELTAGGPAGRFYALQTLGQLGPDVPYGIIEDSPRFAWRGVMLDVARHFMPKDFVLRLIDLLALHKLNVLHLHLTDDQGWRLEIKGYPRLTEVSGDFYTQEDIREIVSYAADRFVTVVPEIEMPGHAQAAIAAYPRLGNQPSRRLEVWDGWGVSEHVLNLDEATLRFCTDVLDEVVDLFPGRYVHVGGDECPPAEWERSETAQRRLRELGLPGAGAARAWFTGRMADHLTERGRRLVYWYEKPGATPGTTAMTWLDEESGPRAATEGLDVVLTPHRRTYFDYPSDSPGPQGFALTLADAYGFTPPETPAGASGRILGVQCQLWTEYMPTPARVEYMAFPRLCAFAEVAWGTAGDYPDFLGRLEAHLARLTARGVNVGPLNP
ncbi:hexosaminidase [Streptosporangium subroseum]|uniref:beta-N-acetylhexosaminidase n=1 Tax=Streptosporangium subroseum TaxID=106412 RepID=A0A239KXQ3_9ACTN|nr:beta-N-acetylhexosaminidase [Streptosporangium subroseum]SNT22522.1 hexosaminidase [Streptosporangium subroseum]